MRRQPRFVDSRLGDKVKDAFPCLFVRVSGRADRASIWSCGSDLANTYCIVEVNTPFGVREFLLRCFFFFFFMIEWMVRWLSVVCVDGRDGIGCG